MFPSKTPILYIVHVLAIFGCVLAAIIGGVIMGQPAALLSLLGLQMLPQFPLMPPESMNQEPGEYDGGNNVGFITDDESK